MTTLDKFNPLRSNPANPVTRVNQGSPADAAQNRQLVAGGGKSLPDGKGGGEPRDASEEQELKQAVNHIADYVQNIRRELNFSVDEKLGRTIVTVIDENGDVIRQIPSEEMLEIARSIARMKERKGKGILFEGDA